VTLMRRCDPLNLVCYRRKPKGVGRLSSLVKGSAEGQVVFVIQKTHRLVWFEAA